MLKLRHFVAGAIGALTIASPFAMAQPALRRSGANATLARLDRPITAEFRDARLQDALRFVSEAIDLEFEVMWRDDVSFEGLGPDARVSANVRTVSALVLLDRILRQVGDEFDPPTWQFDPETGFLQVGPRSRLNEFARIEVYDLRDLLFILPDFRNAPQIDIEAALNQGGQGGGGGGGNIFQDDEGAEVDQPLPVEVAQSVMDAIVELVEPEQWTISGGDGARMRLMDQALVVKAPGYVHRQIIAAGTGLQGRRGTHHHRTPTEARPAPSPRRRRGLG